MSPLRTILTLVLSALPVAAFAEGISQEPPATGDGEMVEHPAPTDPGMIIPAPQTEADEKPADGAITTGVCTQDGKTTGAVTEQQCKESGGVWHETVTPKTGETKTKTKGGAAK